MPEVLLWQQLRGKPQGLKFRKQFPVLGYVADFACVEVRLLVEIDGIAHDMGERPVEDVKRHSVLTNKDWRVIRISAREVLQNPAEVAGSIIALTQTLRPKKSDT